MVCRTFLKFLYVRAGHMKHLIGHCLISPARFGCRAELFILGVDMVRVCVVLGVSKDILRLPRLKIITIAALEVDEEPIERPLLLCR
jgi:hypothetical protein